MGCAGQAVEASGLCAVSSAPEEMAMASADDAATDGEDQGNHPVSRCVLHALSRGICDPCPKGGGARTVAAFGAESREIRGESANHAASYQSLRWSTGNVSLS